MKKLIIILFSVIILFILFLFRFEYTTIGNCLIRINRITGTAKVFDWNHNRGKFELYKLSSYYDIFKGEDVSWLIPRRKEREPREIR